MRLQSCWMVVCRGFIAAVWLIILVLYIALGGFVMLVAAAVSKTAVLASSLRKSISLRL